MNKKELSGMDHLTYYANRFLAEPESMDLVKAVFSPDSEIVKNVSKQLEIHNKIMQDITKARENARPEVAATQPNMQLALNNEQPLVPQRSQNVIPPSAPHRPQANDLPLPINPLLANRDLSV